VDALIIFIRNPELGKVKSRLANRLGAEQALAIYKKLLATTRDVTSQLEYDKFIYYSNFIELHDEWSTNQYKKKQQEGNDLGERMQHAFEEIFELGYSRIVIIGSDCAALTSEQVKLAFDELHHVPAVIGPAIDGGYYLLGLTQPYEFLFKGIYWGSDAVLNQTANKLNENSISFRLLTPLPDVDEVEDVPPGWLTT
jgi:uncharacterized protein